MGDTHLSSSLVTMAYARKGSLMPRQFVYGTQFFRVPNPPRPMRRSMLENIARKNTFNVIRIYPTWDYFNPAPEVYDLEQIDEVMTICDELGLQVLLGIVLETAPYWLEHQLPDARYVDVRGRPQVLGGSPAQITGGWPGLCLDAPPVRDAAKAFIEALVTNASRHSSLFAYDVWNEPRLEPAASRDIYAGTPERLFCYCEHSQVAFREWLHRKYETVERLNDAWVRRFTSFDEVAPPPHHGTYTDWLDWRRFAIDSQTGQMDFRTSIVRALDPARLIESHTAHCPPIDDNSHAVLWATDPWALAERCDVWGASLFPGSLPRQPLALDAQRLDIVRSNARGKDFWLTEIQGGSTSQGVSRGSVWRPQDVRVWNWLAVATGARGILYWAYHAEATGQEAGGYGLVDRAGRDTDRSDEADRFGRCIHDHEATILGYRPTTGVAVLYDLDTSLLDFAMAGNDERVAESHRGYYEAIWKSDVWANYVQPADLDTLLSGLLIVPWHLLGKQDTIGKLLAFLDRGGTLLLEARFGLFDDGLFHNAHVPPEGIADLFGYEEQEPYFQYMDATSDTTQSTGVERSKPGMDALYDGPEIVVNAPVEGRFPAVTYLVPIRVLDAEPIAWCHGLPVGVRKRVGKGTIYYFGTNLGSAIARGSSTARGIVSALISDSIQPDVTGQNLRPRLVSSECGALLIVFNDNSHAQSDDLQLTRGGWTEARELETGVVVPIRANTLTLEVPANDVRVFELTSDASMDSP
jgi:beta-galactosidase GanA